MKLTVAYWPVVILLLATSISSGETIGPFEIRQDTDWTTAGLGGLRGDINPAGNTLTVAGVSGAVTKAYLYWHGPLDTGFSNPAVTFAGNPVVGVSIGNSADNNWGFDRSQAYRADVTSLVTGNGAYSLNVPIIPGSVEANGATLLVFFDDGNSANNRDVVLFDGNDSNQANAFDTAGWQVSLNGINYTAGTASIFFGASDGQDFGPGNDPGVEINGTTLFASDGDFNGNTLPDAGGGVTNGDLWDHRSYDLTSFLSPGLNALSLVSTPASAAGNFDLVSLIVLGIDLPAGAAPPEFPEPSGIILALIGAVTVGVTSLKRRWRRL